MKRILTISALGLIALGLAGCTNEGGAVLAQTPGGGQMNTTVANPGKYTLYHVTKYDKWGAPTETQEVVSLDLKANEKIGFDYKIPDDKQYELDARSDCYAYAGSFRKYLGPIDSMEDHYYWADPNGWQSYWSAKPERAIGTKAFMY